ncbi:serine protease family protein [Marinitenerispora sediminis]|uniref:hypothetical protein n=1 Tax=Marinitenerispora sediminis TaxID=1931232 RepID=UPI001F1D1A58|nr:hypothetical protein [Marinitenerispora sediminis]
MSLKVASPLVGHAQIHLCPDFTCTPTLIGWERKPEILQQLDTETVPDDRCAELDGDLCSGHPTDEAQVCSTDSGGP